MDSQNYFCIQTIDQLVEKADSQDMIIYGAGKVALILIQYLHQNALSKNLVCVAVTSKVNNPKEILGIPVCGIDELDAYKNAEIIIATLEDKHFKIIEELSKYNFKKYCAVGNTLYAELRRQFPSYEAEIQQSVDWLKEQARHTKETLKEIEGLNTFWVNRERGAIKANFGVITQVPDFKDKFLKLVNGLDSESVEIIVRVIKRMEWITGCGNYKIDLFTESEKMQLRIMKQNFNDLLLKLDEDLFSYKNYLLPCDHFEAGVFYYKHGIEKVKNKERIRGGKIIDAGGFIGDSILVLEELEPEKIYSFEAVPEHYELMKRTIELNHINNAVLENSALGAGKGKMEITVAGSSSSILDTRSGEKIEVPVISLDEYVKEHKIENIDLIKVDIEGAEPAFLEGAEETIRKYKPILLLSIYHNVHDFFELKPKIEGWDLGYHFSIYKPATGSVYKELLLIAEIY